MRTGESVSVARSNEKRDNVLPLGAKNCPTIHVLVARAIWPDKTAENWAAEAGRKPSVGKVWLRGEVSAEAKLAIIRLLD